MGEWLRRNGGILLAGLALMLSGSGGAAEAAEVMASQELVEAVRRGRINEVRAAVEAGESPNALGMHGRNQRVPLLYLAVAEGRTAVAHYLRDHGAKLPASFQPMLDKLLRNCGVRKREASGLLALEFGAEPDLSTLHSICRQRGFQALVEKLLDRGLDPDDRTVDGQTAFDVATGFNNFDSARVIVANGGDPTAGQVQEALYNCLRAFQQDLVERILSAESFEVDAETATRLLASTARYGNVQPAAALAMLRLGADPMVRDASTLLRMNVDLPRLADIEALTGRALHDVYRQAGQNEVAEAFAARAPEGPNRRLDNRSTPLIEAVKRGDLDNVAALLAAGAWTELTDGERGRTPLMWATAGGRTSLIAPLIAAGASTAIRGPDGETALELAIRGGFAEAVQVLLECGADVPDADDGGPAPEALARALGETEVVRVFETLRTAAAQANWTDDYDGAVAAAEEKGKPLLLLFTASDWCGFCAMLDRDILHAPAFKALVGDRAGLVVLDYPLHNKQSTQSQERRTRQAELKARYGNQRGSLGFPTMVMIRPDGTELTRRSGYSPAGKADWYLWLRTSLQDHADGSGAAD